MYGLIWLGGSNPRIILLSLPPSLFSVSIVLFLSFIFPLIIEYYLSFPPLYAFP